MLGLRQRLLLITTLALPPVLLVASCDGKAARVTPSGSHRGTVSGTTAVGSCVVKGKVTHAGRPIPVGRLLIYYADGPVPAAATIRPDGSYVATQLPVGTARIAVLLDPNGKPPGQRFVGWSKDAPGWETVAAPTGQGNRPPILARRMPLNKVVPELTSFTAPARELPTLQRLHAKYASPFTRESPKVEVRAGTTTFDIELR